MSSVQQTCVQQLDIQRNFTYCTTTCFWSKLCFENRLVRKYKHVQEKQKTCDLFIYAIYLLNENIVFKTFFFLITVVKRALLEKCWNTESIFWFLFSHIWIEYGYLPCKYLYPFRIQENKDQKKLLILTFSTQANSLLFII